jgi:protein-tyrosine phosphatase
MTAPSENAARRPAGAPVFRIVAVCSGNRFRSPLVEGFIRRETRGLPVDVSSCGVLDLEGLPPLSSAVEGAARLGVDISGHRSRGLADVDLREVDLVLGFERAHVARAVVDSGAAREKTFTALELVELLETAPAPDGATPVDRARKAVQLAAQYRRPRAGTPVPELSDPINESGRVQRARVRRLHELSLALVGGLFGTESALFPPTAARR